MDNVSQSTATTAQAVDTATPETTTPETTQSPNLSPDQLMELEADIVVDGQKQKAKIKDAIRAMQLEKASYKRFEDSAKLRKEIESLIKESKDDPDKFFKYVGIDPIQYAEKKLGSYIKMQQMSEPERKALTLEEQKAALEQELSQYKQSEQMQKESALIEKEKAVLEQEVMDLLEKNQLPKDRTLVRMAAAEKAYWLKHDYNMPWDKAIERVKNNRIKDSVDFIAALPTDQLLKLFPKEFLNKLRKADLERIRGQVETPKVVEPKKTDSPFGSSSKTKKGITMSEFMDSLRA